MDLVNRYIQGFDHSLSRSMFSVEGVDLTDEHGRWWVREDHKMHGLNDAAPATVKLGRRDGELVIPGSNTTGTALFELSMTITGVSYLDMLRNKAFIDGCLAPGSGHVTIHETTTGARLEPNGDRGTVKQNDGLDLFAQCYPISTNLSQPWTDSSLHCIDVDYKFMIPDGVWYSSLYQEADVSGGTTKLERDGSARRYNNIIEVYIGSYGRFRIENNNDPEAFIHLYNDSASSYDVTINTRTGLAYSGSQLLQHMVTMGRNNFYLDAEPDFFTSGSCKVITYPAWY